MRVEWLLTPVESRLTTARARAAFLYFCEHPTYRFYLHKHRLWLADKAADPSLHPAIKTAHLLLHAHGIEVAARPILYPHHAYGDSDLRSRLEGVHVAEEQRVQIRVSVLRKLLSPCLGYAADFKLLFLLFDIFSARRIMGIQKIASVRGVSAEIASQNRADSEAYWRREQDYLCDIVRQMEARQELPENADLYAYTHHGTAPRLSLIHI